MRCALAVALAAVVILAVSVMGGCKKRYIPRVSEEIIDPGVPIYQETVVE